MGAHTYGPDDGKPAEDPADVRVAFGSDDPTPEEPGKEEPPAADATQETPPSETPETPPAVEDVRPRRPETDTKEPSVGKQLRAGWQRVVSAIATAVVILSVVIAVILALHIVFEVFDANEKNSIVEFVNGWATDLAYGFKDLFVPKDAAIRVTVNYGLAAVVYLVAGRILAGIIRRLG